MQTSLIPLETGEISLPQHFPVHALLDFHRRDAAQLAERVIDVEAGHCLEKALRFGDQALLLRLNLPQSQEISSISSDITPKIGYQILSDKAPDEADKTTIAAVLKQRIKHMIGLTQPITTFEAEYENHATIGPLVSNNRGLRVPQTPTPYEAMVWAIIGQQISVKAAIAIRHRVIKAINKPLQLEDTTLYCFPEAADLLATDANALTDAGLSQSKLNAILKMSDMVDQQQLPFEEWLLALQQYDHPEKARPLIDEMREQLLAIKGIGPWTVNYLLLRGFAWLDGSLHGDVAVRRNLRALLEQESAVEAKQAEQWLADFSPWRALVGAHLWARQSAAGF